MRIVDCHVHMQDEAPDASLKGEEYRVTCRSRGRADEL
jgi:hypothetical protein